MIENIAISSENGHIRLSNLPEYLFAERPGADAGSSLLPASLTFSAIEKEAIIHAARVTSGRVQDGAVAEYWPHHAVAKNETVRYRCRPV